MSRIAPNEQRKDHDENDCPAGLAMLVGLRIELRVPFFVGAQAVDDRRKNAASSEMAPGTTRTQPRIEARSVPSSSRTPGTPSRRADNVRPAELVAQTVQIKAMRADAAEKEGERGGQRFRAETPVTWFRCVRGSGRRVVHRERKENAVGNGSGLAQSATLSRRRGILRPRGRAFTRLNGSARNDRIAASHCEITATSRLGVRNTVDRARIVVADEK